AFAMLLDEATWEGRRRVRPVWASAMVGALLGITVQTLVTQILSAGVLALAAGWLVGAGVSLGERRRRVSVLVGSAIVTFAAAPAWYVATGMGTAYWNSWWVYGTYMTRA